VRADFDHRYAGLVMEVGNDKIGHETRCLR
jgi:hypothetical protein